MLNWVWKKGGGSARPQREHIQHYFILQKNVRVSQAQIFPCKLLEPASGWLASWSSLKGKIGLAYKHAISAEWNTTDREWE